MYDLNNAEIIVETRFSIESGNNDGKWFYLSDYSSLDEFLADCASWFSDEDNPEYVFLNWNNIPDDMITEKWLSPHIFGLRDALQSIDEEYHSTFFDWCRTFGWDIGSDDPHKIVMEFEYAMSDLLKPDNEQYCHDEDELVDTAYFVIKIGCELFSDDYN